MYQRLYKGIMSDPRNIADTAAEALDRVKTDKFGYISETTALKLKIFNNCQLALIKERFLTIRHAFVVSEGWPYKKYFDEV